MNQFNHRHLMPRFWGQSGSVVEHQTPEWEVVGSKATSPFLEQDTLLPEKYWKYPGSGGSVPTWLNFFDWDVKAQCKVFTLARVVPSINSYRATVFICPWRYCPPLSTLSSDVANTQMSWLGRRYVRLTSRHGDGCWTSWPNTPINYIVITRI